MKRQGAAGLAVLLAVGVLLAACSAPRAPEQVHPGQQPPTKGPVGGAASGRPTRLATIEGLLLGTPIYDGDFADPFALVQGDEIYAYATNTVDANVPVLRWVSLEQGEYLGDALPNLPSWTTKGLVWAPAVWADPSGGYVLYYATVDDASKRQCISRATATSPAGPFTDDSSAAMICPLDLGGAIDPSVFVDDQGTLHLLYKNDGNCCGITTSIWSVPMAADGLSTAGDPVQLISADQPWEGGLIEGPSMVADGDEHLLFYSANAWDTSHYAIGYARCTAPTGPCTKPEDRAWMTSTAFAKGPGGEEFFADADGVWMVYHGWLPGEIGPPKGERRLYLDGLTVRDGRPERIGRDAAAAALAPYAVGALVLLVGLGAGALWLRSRRRHRAGADT